MFRRHRDPAAGRRPHPDPRTEAVLQRIISLRRTIDRNQAHLDAAYRDIRIMRRKSRRIGWSAHDAAIAAERAEYLLDEAHELEEGVTSLHDEIAKLMSALTDTDLAYL